MSLPPFHCRRIEPLMLHRLAPAMDDIDACLAELAGPILITYARRQRPPAGRYGAGPWV